MLILELLQGDLNILAQLTLLVMPYEHHMFDFLLVQIEGHGMVFTEILNFPFLVDKFAFFVLHLFFCNDPVVVDFLSLLLEVSEQFLLFFVGLLELSELFSHGEFVLL